MRDNLFLLTAEDGIAEDFPEHLLRPRSNILCLGRLCRPSVLYLYCHRLPAVAHWPNISGFYAGATHSAKMAAKTGRHLPDFCLWSKQTQQKSDMQLALMVATGATTMGDQLVVARVQAERVVAPAEPDITLRSPESHAAILRRSSAHVHAGP